MCPYLSFFFSPSFSRSLCLSSSSIYLSVSSCIACAYGMYPPRFSFVLFAYIMIYSACVCVCVCDVVLLCDCLFCCVWVLCVGGLWCVCVHVGVCVCVGGGVCV